MASGPVFRGDLTTFASEAMAAERMLIGLRVAPFFPVEFKDGQYPRFLIPEAQLLRDLATERAIDGTYPEVVRQYEMATYSCVDRGLEERVDAVYAADMARFFDAEVTATVMTTRNVLIAHERRVAQLAMGSSFAATGAVVSYTPANIATVDFIRDVQDRIDDLNNNGEEANTLVMSATIANFVKRTPLFQNFVKGYGVAPGGAIPTDSVIRAAFADLGITQLLIGRLGVDTNKTRGNKTMTPIWGNDYIWVGRVEGGDPYAGGAMRTMAWTEFGGEIAVESYRDETRRSEMVRVMQHTDEAIINANSGRRITTGYSPT